MAHCDAAGQAPRTSTGARKIVLAGNPNVGKSAVFNALTGTYVTVSNFPGTTVEILRGKMGEQELLDTPGVYGVSSFNDEEVVARDVIIDADVVVNVVDAVHLERDLFLTLQLIDMGLPLVVALNMTDEARRQGVHVDADLLGDILGVPVVPMVAVKGEGIAALKDAIERARPGHWSHEFDEEIERVQSVTGNRAEALLVLEGDEQIAARHGLQPGVMRDAIYRDRRMRVDDLVGHVVQHRMKGASIATRLSYLMMQPWTGVPMLLGVLWLLYKILGEFVAGTVVDFLESGIMLRYVEPVVRSAASAVFGEGSVPFKFIAGEFGVLTMTPTYLFGVILPLVTGFYFLMSLLEDSGYLPRVATLMDRVLMTFGLNGRAIIPIILGFGCVTMGTLTTRILGSRRERIIATTLMAIAVPCSAQIGVIAALMAGVSVGYAMGYLLAIAAVFVLLGTLLARITPGRTTDLLIDIPPLRVPMLSNVLRKTGVKVWHFMREVTVFFAAGALLISLLEVTGALGWLQSVAAPVTVSWLHLPREAATAFVMGFIRRDFGAAGFFLMDLTPAQLLVGMVTITLFVPCIASVMVILKERGWRYLVGLLVLSVSLAFAFGGVLARLLEVIA
ncbi:MAG: ferrous iron transport protein B [Coriobacteriia bacterium]